LNCKERVLAAVNHEEPDRVPFNLNLCPRLWEEVASFFGVSVEKAMASPEICGDFFPPGYQPLPLEVRYARARKVLPDGKYIDEWGTLRDPKFRGGGTIDWFVDHPIKEPEDLDAYEFPDPDKDRCLNELDEYIRKYGDEYVVRGRTGEGWGLFEHAAHFLHGFEAFLKDLYLRPKFMEDLLDRVTEYRVEVVKRVMEREIDWIDMGADYGSQQGPLINPSLWRKFEKPRLRKIFELPRKKGVHVHLHSDGNIVELIPDLIEVGITILNPIQPLAMDPALIKEKFGKELCFDGTLDVQHTLPYGSPKDVENEVKTRMRTVGYDGGLILAPSHTVTEEVPLENVIALIKAIKKFGKYPAKSL